MHHTDYKTSRLLTAACGRRTAEKDYLLSERSDTDCHLKQSRNFQFSFEETIYWQAGGSDFDLRSSQHQQKNFVAQ